MNKLEEQLSFGGYAKTERKRLTWIMFFGGLLPFFVLGKEKEAVQRILNELSSAFSLEFFYFSALVCGFFVVIMVLCNFFRNKAYTEPEKLSDFFRNGTYVALNLFLDSFALIIGLVFVMPIIQCQYPGIEPDKTACDYFGLGFVFLFCLTILKGVFFVLVNGSLQITRSNSDAQTCAKKQKNTALGIEIKFELYTRDRTQDKK